MTKHKFTPQAKASIVLEFLNTNTSVAEICRKYNVTPHTFYAWKERFVEGGKNAIAEGTRAKHRSGINGSSNMQKENEDLKKIVGELTLANDLLKKTLEGAKR